MAIAIEVKCEPDDALAMEIRTLFCHETGQTVHGSLQALQKFNRLLYAITQEAFDEGRRFAKQHPEI